MKPRVLGRLVAHPPFLLLVERQIARGKSQTGAHSIAIRTRTDRKNLQPGVGIAAIVAEELSRSAVIAYQNVEVAVGVEIAHRGAPANARRLDVRSQLIADVYEHAIARVVEHQLRLRIAGARPVALDVVEHMNGRHEYVPAAVVVVVKTTTPNHTRVECRLS